jgi:desulfoferrodoxin (superoxide reductase-like protein)
MKKIGILFLALTLLFSSVVFGHPAKKVELSYDSKTKELKIVVYHGVSAPESHFIDLVSIEVNGKEFSKKEFVKQSDKEKEEFVITMTDIKKGDVIIAKTRCNKFGNKSGKLTVE